MLQRRQSLELILFAGVGTALAGCSGGGGGGGAAQSGDTVLVAMRKRGLNRFLRAVDAAGLEETLSGPGPFTVFAPTDRAMSMARLPSDPAQLRALVGYHVVPGMFTAEFLRGHDLNYTTASGRSVNVDGSGAGLRVDGANVVTADLTASNGVVHVIDRVLTPA